MILLMYIVHMLKVFLNFGQDQCYVFSFSMARMVVSPIDVYGVEGHRNVVLGRISRSLSKIVRLGNTFSLYTFSAQLLTITK